MSETKGLTNELLKEKMPDAMVDRGSALDLDTLINPGIYICQEPSVCAVPPQSLGNFWRYGVVEVMRRNVRVFQRLTCQKGCVMRTFSETEIPGAWTTVALFS